MRVPLHNYPDMLSAENVAEILDCSTEQARRLMEQMDHIDISVSTSKRRFLRVSKEDFARKFGLKPSLYLKKGIA